MTRPPERDWTAAREKIDSEGECRCRLLGGCEGHLQAAHVMGRRFDRRVDGPRGGIRFVVAALDVVPLCVAHHLAYDARTLDLLPFLTLEEQAAAAGHVGLERARKRVSGGAV